jgi:hypothetical protein
MREQKVASNPKKRHKPFAGVLCGDHPPLYKVGIVFSEALEHTCQIPAYYQSEKR